MFSPDSTLATINGNSARNPRRRPRDSTEATRQPQRKRSKLSNAAYPSPEAENANGNGSVVVNGSATGANGVHAHYSGHDIPVRGKKHSASGVRPLKEDGSEHLTKTGHYSLRQLPSLPDRLRKSSPGSYRAALSSNSSYALALTQDSAIVWDYTLQVQSPTPYILRLPFASKASDPLPMGTIVCSAGSPDTGLLVVNPASGKVVFWENVEGAEALGLFQQRGQQLEGYIGGLHTSERVVDIVEAEHAGFVVVLNTGRLALLSLRDAQGRPQIATQFLRTTSATSSSGLFGSIKSIISPAAWHQEVAAVKTRSSTLRGQVEVIACTGSGLFHFWDVSSSGQHIFRKDVNAQTEMRREVLHALGREAASSSHEQVRVLDFVYTTDATPAENEQRVVAGGSQVTTLLVLVAVSGRSHSDFALVEVDLVDERAVAERVITLPRLNAAFSNKDTAKLRLPDPGHTAYILFPQAMVLASVARPDEKAAADAQLQDEVHEPIDLCQDVIRFRAGTVTHILASCVAAPARRTNHSTCILWAHGKGLLKLSGKESIPKSLTRTRRLRKAKIQLEQATFYGSQAGNVVDFSASEDVDYETEHIEEAAVSLSHEILSSSCEAIPHAPASMTSQLALRSKSLRDLANYVLASYPDISRRCKWELLWGAERLTAAQGLWKYYEEQISDTKLEQRPLLGEIIDLLHAKKKLEMHSDVEETDKVRAWFISAVETIDIVVPWAYNCIQALYIEGVRSPRHLLQLAGQAADISITALEAAFALRKESVEAYGLGFEELVDGVPADASTYHGLPSFWTSNHNIVNCMKALLGLISKMTGNDYERHNNVREEDRPSDQQVEVIGHRTPDLVHVSWRVHLERACWLLAQDDLKEKSAGEVLKREFDQNVRPKMIAQLITSGLSFEAIQICERMQDMPSLVVAVEEEKSFVTSMLLQDPDTFVRRHKRVVHFMQDNFVKYGDRWADALFEHYIAEGRPGAIFDYKYTNEKYAVRFVKADPARAKLSWFMEVGADSKTDEIAPGQYSDAGETLQMVAKEQETNTWSTKTELSLAKLSLLAAASGEIEAQSNGNSAHVKSSTKSVDEDLEICYVQRKLYMHLQDEITKALDESGAVDLLMDTFGKHSVSNRPAFQHLLGRGFGQVVEQRHMSVRTLVDVLTLMDSVPTPFPEHDISGMEFVMALQVISAGRSALERVKMFEPLLKLTWRRCFLRDDWRTINDTKGKSDKEIHDELERTSLFATLKEGFSLGLFESGTGVEALQPSSVTGTGCSADDPLLSHLRESDKQPLVADHKADDKQLQQYISKARLGHWYEGVIAAAKDSLKEDEKAKEVYSVKESELMGEWQEPEVPPLSTKSLPASLNLEELEDEYDDDEVAAPMDDVADETEEDLNGGYDDEGGSVSYSQGDSIEEVSVNADEEGGDEEGDGDVEMEDEA